MLETVDYVGNVVVVDGRTLVVQRKTVCLHVVEPYTVGTATVGLGEYEYGGRHSGVGLEHSARHGYYGT